MTESHNSAPTRARGFDIELPLAFTNGRHLIRLIKDGRTLETEFVVLVQDAATLVVAWAEKYSIGSARRRKMMRKALRIVSEFNYQTDHALIPQW